MTETRGSHGAPSTHRLRPEDPTTPPTPPPTRYGRKAPGAGRLVLVVDDEPFVRRVVSRLLTRIGYRTVLASSGSEALSRLGDPDDPVDLLVADATMPEMGGGDLLRRARRLRPDVKALFMRGRGPEGEEDGVPVLAKPFGSIQLYEAVEALLERGGSDDPPLTTAAGD